MHRVIRNQYPSAMQYLFHINIHIFTHDDFTIYYQLIEYQSAIPSSGNALVKQLSWQTMSLYQHFSHVYKKGKIISLET